MIPAKRRSPLSRFAVLWVPAVVVLLAAAAFGGKVLQDTMREMDARSPLPLALQRATAEPRVVAAFGTPLELHKRSGRSTYYASGAGFAEWSLDIVGPSGEGTMTLAADRSPDGIWTFDVLQVRTPDGIVDLVAAPRTPGDAVEPARDPPAPAP